ncbi:MAG: hypothetical protein E7K64_08025, partial [Clostridia bacterium]|nr:hypothetical protein [Clostridia bacterium]
KLLVRRVEVSETEVKIYFNFPADFCRPELTAPACTLGRQIADLLSLTVERSAMDFEHKK